MRNVNINREPVSSEEISTYKDFKSILRKHAQTTEDLAKINPGKSKVKIWVVSGIAGIAILSSVLFFGSDEEKTNDINTPVVDLNLEKPVVKPVIEQLKWDVVFNSKSDPIHDHFDFDQISSERVEFIKFKETKKIKSLIPNIDVADALFASNKQVFKLSSSSTLKLSPNKNLLKLVQGTWTEVNHNPVTMPSLVKPRRIELGKKGIRIDAVGFGDEYKEFENVWWQAVNFDDLDSSFFDTQFSDGSIEETNVKGVYNITLTDGDVVKKFNGYPVLQKYAYEKAMKKYNADLVKQQEKLKNEAKSFDLEKGIYTIE